MCLDGVADKHKLFKNYFSPCFKLFNLNKFHTLPSGNTTLEKQMDWSSPSQPKSKNFHLVNTTQIKITCLMGKKSGGKSFLNRKIVYILYFSLMVGLLMQSSTICHCILSLCQPWNDEINYVYLPSWTSSSIALCPLISAGITSNIPNLCWDVKQPLLLLEKKELPQKCFLLFLQNHFFFFRWGLEMTTESGVYLWHEWVLDLQCF